MPEQEQEPLKVRVARALGHWSVRPGVPGAVEQLDAIPDYPNDPAFFVGVIEKHGLFTSSGFCGSQAWSWNLTSPMCDHLGTAVCEWFVAYAAAGGKVKG